MIACDVPLVTCNCCISLLFFFVFVLFLSANYVNHFILGQVTGFGRNLDAVISRHNVSAIWQMQFPNLSNSWFGTNQCFSVPCIVTISFKAVPYVYKKLCIVHLCMLWLWNVQLSWADEHIWNTFHDVLWELMQFSTLFFVVVILLCYRMLVVMLWFWFVQLPFYVLLIVSHHVGSGA